MCSGIEHEDQLLLWKDPEVRLPVRRRDGSLAWLRWGERHGVKGPFVEGPCARLESIRAGRWSRFQPVPVRIPVSRYMERDARGTPYWVKPPSGACLQGLVATWQGEQRLYVVTVPAPPEHAHVQPRWPRVLTGSGHHGEEQECSEDGQVHGTLHDGGSPG